MNREQAVKLCELLGVNPDAPVGKTDRATALAEFFTTSKPAETPKP